MKKLPICSLCKKRKVPQDEWKTEEEKQMCFTCFVFKNFCTQLVQTLQVSADEKNIKRLLYIVLAEDERTTEKKLLEMIMPEKNTRVRIVDKKVYQVLVQKKNIKQILPKEFPEIILPK